MFYHFLSSCDKEPIAHFEIDTGRGSAVFGVNETVRFTSSCVDAYGYRWEFGDGSSIFDEVNTSHIYKEPGNYVVRMTIFSKRHKKSDSQTVNLTVKETGEITFWMGQNLGTTRVEFLDYTDYITADYSSISPILCCET